MRSWVRHTISIIVCLIIFLNYLYVSLSDKDVTNDNPLIQISHQAFDKTTVKPPEPMENLDGSITRTSGSSNFIMHDIIRIDNDTDMLNTAKFEGWSGKGTNKKPIIIENFEINGNGSLFCIYIKNITSTHFIIRNCKLYNTDRYWRYDPGGIVLINIGYNKAPLGKILNNYCFNNTAGILVRNSDNILIKNNTFIYGADGISIINSNHIKCVQNNCSDNGQGIYNEEGSYIQLINNKFNDNWYGIFDDSGYFEIIDNNTCNYNKMFGILIGDSDKIINNHCISNKYGIYIYHGGYSNISNNYCAMNNWGMYIITYSSCIISYNYCISNIIGIYVCDSTDNSTIMNNICNLNKNIGISIDYSWGYQYSNLIKNRCINNSCSNNKIGILINHSRYTIIKNNHIRNNIISLRINNSEYNTIASNICISYHYGFYNTNLTNDNLFYNNYFQSKLNYADPSCIRNVWNITKQLGRNIVNGPYLGGNYWSDYFGVDKNNDALGDTRLPHPPGDHRPLIPVNLSGPNGKLKINKLDSEPPTTGDSYNFETNIVTFNYVRSVNIRYWFFENLSRNYTLNLTKGDIVNGTYSTEIQVPDNAVELVYQIIVCDQRGVWFCTELESISVIDNDGPILYDLTYFDPITGENYSVYFQVSDNIETSSVFLEYWFDGDKNTVQNSSLVYKDGIYSLKILIPLNAQNITYIISAIDTSSNWASNLPLHKKVIDNILPTITENCGVPTTGDWFELKFEINDNVEIITEYLIYGFDAEIMQNISLYRDTDFLIKVPNNASVLHATLIAIDRSNNQNRYDIIKPVIDNDPPTIEDEPTDRPMTGEIFELKFNISENRFLESIVIEYSFDSGEPNITELIGSNNLIVYYLNVPSNAEYLSYEIVVIDNENNLCILNNTISIIDTIPPRIIDLTKSSPTTGDVFTISATVSDNIGLDYAYLTYWCDNDPPTFSGFEKEVKILIPSVAKMLNFLLKATDINKNINYLNRTLEILDNDLPIINDKTIFKNRTIEFSVNVKDNFKVTKVVVNCWIDDNEVSTYNLTPHYNNYYKKITIPVTAKTFNYYVTAEDNSGNKNNTVIVKKDLNITLLAENKNEGSEKSSFSIDAILWISMLIIIMVIVVTSFITVFFFKMKIILKKKNGK